MIRVFRRIVLTAILVLVFVTTVFAVDITIPPNMNSITVTFTNGDLMATAIDFDIIQRNAPTGIWIGGGDGGLPFPKANPGAQVPQAGAGFFGITYDGGPGIPPGETYTHSFVGFAAGTTFSVLFSYPPRTGEGDVLHGQQFAGRWFHLRGTGAHLDIYGDIGTIAGHYLEEQIDRIRQVIAARAFSWRRSLKR